MNKVECKALILAPALKTSNYLEIASDLMKAGKLPTLSTSCGWALRRRRAC